MKKFFCMVLILLLANNTTQTVTDEFENDAIGRQLFLTLDRNQEFYRQEDRSRCKLISSR